MSQPRHFLVATATIRVPVESPFRDFEAATTQAALLTSALDEAAEAVRRLGGTMDASRIRMSNPRNAGGTADDDAETAGRPAIDEEGAEE